MYGAHFWKHVLYGIGSFLFMPVALLAAYSPVVCFALSLDRLRQQDYVSDDGDASKANLRPALNIFYSLSVAQGAIFMSVLILQNVYGFCVILPFVKSHGFSEEVVRQYKDETHLRYMNNQASTKNWNLITYGAGLLDSELPDEFVLGASALNMLIEQGEQIKWLLIRSPRNRIQKLISALGWRSPAEREIRGLAARIVAHLAYDLNLSQFPGALECIYSLLDTSYHARGDQEVLIFPSGGNQKRREGFLFEMIREYHALKNGIKQETKQQERDCKPMLLQGLRYVIERTVIRKYHALKNGIRQETKQQERDGKHRPSLRKGTNEDVLLQGLRILENLAYDKQNCTEIYTRGLLSEITAPFNSENFIEDIEMSLAWIKIVVASLRVVSQLVKAPGDTGTTLRHKIACNSRVMKNLEEVLVMEGDSSILELQTYAMEVVARLFTDKSTNMSKDRRDSLIERALHIFLDNKWMEDYFQDRRKKIAEETTRQLAKNDEGPSFWEDLCPCLLEKKTKKRRKALEEESMRKSQEIAMKHKEMAGKALAMLSVGSQSSSEVNMDYTDVIPCLTKMLDSKIKTMKCSISETEILTIEMRTAYRISAAQILRNLYAHTVVNDDSIKKTLLEKVLKELLNINRKTESQARGGSSRNTSAATRNDIEDPAPQGSDQLEPSTRRSLQRPDERMLQAALLSLYARIRATWSDADDFASVVVHLVAGEDFVRILKAVVEENNYATPACLAILKITCEMIILLMQHNRYLDEIKKMKIVDTLAEASETMSGLESYMLFAGVDHDCHGVKVKPLSSALVKEAKLLFERVYESANNNSPAGGPEL